MATTSLYNMPMPPSSVSGQSAQVGAAEGDGAIGTDDSHSRPAAAGDSRRALDEATIPPAKRRRVIYLCEPCGTYYTEKRALARHRHTNTHRRNTGLPPAQKYACTICGREFSRDHDRHRHENEKHHGLRRSGPRGQKTEQSPAADSVLGSSHLNIGEDEHDNVKVEDRSISFSPPHQRNRPHITFQDPTSDISSAATSKSVARQVAPLQSNRVRDNYEARDGTDPADVSRRKKAAHAVNTDPHERSWFADLTDDDDDDDEDEADAAAEPGDFDFGGKADEETTGHDQQSDIHGHKRQRKSEDDEAANGTPMSEFSSRTGSTTADSGVDMSQDAQHEAKYPTIKTYDFRSNSDSTLIVPGMDGQRSASKPSLPVRPHTSVVQRNGTARTVAAASVPLCIFCNQVFEHDWQDLLPHLRRHLDSFSSEWPCKICKISFVHKEDLNRHQVDAEVLGNCGFKFGHTSICTGHHPPKQDDSNTDLSDWDRFRLCVQLRGWEQQQLRVYMANIRDLIAIRNARTSQAYSIEALFKRSRDSFSSFAISVKTLGSAPCDETFDGKRDIGGLQHRMRMMSIKGSTSQVRHTAKKLPAILRSGGINKALHNAACAGDIQQIERLLSLGADLGVVVNEQTILSAAAERADLETVTYLINQGADLNAVDAKHGCALASAAFAGKLDVMKYLILLGADSCQPSDRAGCPLSAAAAGGELSSIDMVLERGAPIDQDGGYEGCPLVFAIWNDNLAAAKLLMDHGAEVNHAGGQHGNALCAAIIRLAMGEGQFELVKLLLERGANVNQLGRSGNALRTAASHADLPIMVDVVRLLLARGATVDTPGQTSSALGLAKRQRQHWLEKKTTVIMFADEVEDHINSCDRVIGLLYGAGAEDEFTGTRSLSSRSQSITSSHRPSKDSWYQ